MHHLEQPDRRGLCAALAFLLALGTVLAACGAEKPDGSGAAPVVSDGAAATTGAPAGGSVELDLAWDGLESPVMVVSPPRDPRVFIVEQPGGILVTGAPGSAAEPWLDLTADVGSDGPEQGLLGLAFHPDFSTNGLIYVDFTDKDGDTQLVELEVDPAGTTTPARIRSRRTLLSIPQPYENHNGGNVVFGPDGWLWVGTGDGGAADDPEDRAQDDSELLGKMLRVDVESGVVETWAKGLRNPWRYSFDRETGDLWIGDVGQDAQEEIDLVRAEDLRAEGGPNFAWPAFEGEREHRTDVTVDSPHAPTAVYSHDDPSGGGCSVTGGHVYRGPTIPALDGKYVFGDYCSGIIWTLDAESPGPATRLGGVPDGLMISSFGEDADGRLYVVDHGGRVYMFRRT
ncbi:MAG: PQQ-dependent sugar dehydrogenase [Acidimicrobiia bacterium]|nr:PQQ-dependent sugar dehydrogenase [Acidimicrobiia bacterium]